MGGDAYTGVVAAGHPLTARAGARILADGGTAVDAAVAAAFTAAVAESALTGPGAGGFLLVANPGDAPVLLDFFVAAPGLGDPSRRLREEMLHAFTVPFGGAEQVFHIGPASVAVPGMVQGLCAAAERFGRMPLRDLVAPAVELARAGVELSPQVAYLHQILGEMLTHTPPCAQIYAPNGTVAGQGDRLVFHDLADTLERIGQTGAAAMQPGGWLAEAIVAHQRDTGGLVSHIDIARYEVATRVPWHTRFRGYEVHTNPPPSAGGVLIAAALSSIDPPQAVTDDVTHYRGVARAGEIANAMRGDAFMEMLHADLPAAQWDDHARDAAAAVAETRKPAGSTTHISVIDPQGRLASLSSSNGAGSGVMVPGTGVMLNNMLGEEDLNPQGFGRIPPGRRLTSMMAPTVVTRDGQAYAALGAAGSNRLRSAITQTLVSLIDGGRDVWEAVHRPRVHPEGGGLDVEGGVSDEVCQALVRDGHRLRRWEAANLFFGGVSAVVRTVDAVDGAGDPRRGGGAAAITSTGDVVELRP